MPDQPPVVAPPTAPIVMDASSTATAKAVGFTVLAAIAVVVTAIPTLVALIKARDIMSFLVWLETQPGIQFLGAIGFLATSAGIIWHRLNLRWRSLTAGRSAHDADVIVKNDVPTVLPSGMVSTPSPKAGG